MTDQKTIPAPAPDPAEGPGKGAAFFDQAVKVAETGNFDYAIEMYIQGLFREPQNTDQHEALYHIGLRRKVTGGKPAGGFLGPKMYYKGKTPKELMLSYEWILAKDPGNIPTMRQLIKAANQGGYAEVIKWLLPIMLKANRTQKTPSKELFLEIADYYEGLHNFPDAIVACNDAAQLTPGDMELQSRIKNLAASHTIRAGNYEGGGDFKQSIKDKDRTKELLQEESLSQTDAYKLDQIAKAKKEYEANPKELQVISKYVATLLATEDEEHENVAIGVLQRAYDETRVYKHKAQIGDVKIKQSRRQLRMLVDAYKKSPDPQLREDIKGLEKELLDRELEHLKDLTANYPTELKFQFELGKRYYRAKLHDEAMKSFQMTQNTPRYRWESLKYLGLLFTGQGLKHEGAQTLRAAIEAYEYAETGDANSKEMHYALARASEEAGEDDEAVAVYSKIAQWDITYLDVRPRLEALRKKKRGG